MLLWFADLMNVKQQNQSLVPFHQERHYLLLVFGSYGEKLLHTHLLISDHIKGPLVAASRSPMMKALDRSVETLGL